MPLICLSEYLYHNKNEYFDLLRTTQYSGGYIRGIKFFVCAVGEAAKQSAKLLAQYENDILWAEQQIKENTLSSKSIWGVYNYLKRYPVSSISRATEQTRFSFNSISKAMQSLKEAGIVQETAEVRNRIWVHKKLIENLWYF